MRAAGYAGDCKAYRSRVQKDKQAWIILLGMPKPAGMPPQIPKKNRKDTQARIRAKNCACLPGSPSLWAFSICRGRYSTGAHFLRRGGREKPGSAVRPRSFAIVLNDENRVRCVTVAAREPNGPVNPGGENVLSWGRWLFSFASGQGWYAVGEYLAQD